MATRKPDGYVYQITNTINGKKYIGSHAGFNPNYMGSGVALKHAFKKYGQEHFSKQIVMHCANYQELEEQILVVLDAANDPQFYNLKNSAVGGATNTGRTLTAETRANMSAAHKGKIKTAEHRAKLSASRKGKPQPVATCPHCKTVGSVSNMHRWHFDNCKHKKTNLTI